MTHLCEETLVTVVNGQLPGPAIEVTEGDSVAVHVINKSPYNMTIHWHGVKQRLNCWADGVPMITQCPIRPNHSFTYRFNVSRQEITLWWHAHVSCLRGSVHGAFIIRPRHGASSYPFPKPHREVPLVIGEWWQTDLGQIDKSLTNGFFGFNPSSATINGKLGDLNNCSGGLVEEGYVLEVEEGKNYLLRLINAALMSEYYFKIAGHKFTVVAADANYVKPYTTDVIAIAPGETVDALLVADAAPERSYYMVALANQPSITNPPFPVTVTRGTLAAVPQRRRRPLAPEMPDLHDMMPSFYFHGNLTSLRLAHPRGRTVPAHVDERLLVTLSMGSVCRNGGESCARGGSIESIIVATMNNVSFQLPATTKTTTLLAAHYNHSHSSVVVNGTGEQPQQLYTPLPERPPRPFNFTDRAFIPIGPTEAEARLEPTPKATTGRRFLYGAAVEVVFQNTAVMQSDYNPMHLHGHDMFVVAQGHGDFDAARDVPARYNLVDPPVRNTVLVPSLGWAAVRFVADNPGVWYLHCHYEFHVAVGMATVFVTEDGPTVGSALPPPPADLPKCGGGHGSSLDVMENDLL
ncbi:laccase-15-like [Miscanthus floridulus]|uniref:laccase-15-like n=1 Tax=Miscanthus floridulus TaxID=154761 RepID=UPI0034575E04